MNAEHRSRNMYLFLFVLVVVSTVAFQGWRILLNNFAVEEGGFSGLDMGIVQSVREVPGFLALLAVYLLLLVREHRLAALSVMILGAGVAAAGLFPSVWGIAATTLVMSFGFHYFETMNQSLTLQYFDKAETPLVLGRLRSVMALTNILVGGAVYVLARWMGFEELFALMGGVAVVGGLWALTRDPTSKNLPPQHKKMILRSRYWLFYVLTFLAGARRQIFVAFAVFLLVQKFQYSVQDIIVLFVCNNVINYFANPLIARAVNRFGERKVLSLEYLSLVAVFTAYAFTDSAWVAGGLYVADNIVFNFSMAIKTFYQKIADPRDIASGMAVGFTINHIAAVVVPFMGGLAWMADYRIVFLGAVVLSLASLVCVQFMDGQLRSLSRD
ncbi:MFS transporter [Salidesulfovibrio onnuriiensis]|uniref:MFS transporter n=1 Tax=Salidesulfovibrio onnuriiensis TaxID=2583823 RepID=UPI0011C9926D|nr:MFS transporter [Salidesulfovibrio onnuriiensis]